MDEQLIALYHRHVGTAFDRQMRFGAFLEKKDAGEEWQYDHETATLSFGKLAFEAPLVGSHAHNNHSWLWAWSNKHIRLTLTNRALGDAVRATWHHRGLHQLGGPGFALEPLLGTELTESAVHIFGVVLSRELGYDAYYTTPYEGGCGLVLIRDERLAFTEKHPLVRVAIRFPQLSMGMPVLDHKAALSAYAHDYGLTVTEQDGRLKISDGGKDELTATFDGMGRLSALEGVAIPAPEPAKKPVKKAAGKKPAKKKPAANRAKTASPKVAKKPVAKAVVKPKATAAKVGKKPVPKKPVKKAAGKK